MQSVFNLDAYQRDGFTVVRDAIPIVQIREFRALISELIKEEARDAGTSIFAQIEEMNPCRIPHDGLILLRDHDPRHMQNTVDRIKCSPFLARLLTSDHVTSIAKGILCVKDARHIGLSYPNFRADLPQKYRREEHKFSLPWHQESSYYITQASPRSSVVFWIPVFDCGPTDGCLELLAGSHKEGNLEHKSYYVDEKNQRHFRFDIDNSIIENFPIAQQSVNAGDILINHFRVIHRSGINKSSSVRYTLLIRASNMFCPGYVA